MTFVVFLGLDLNKKLQNLDLFDNLTEQWPSFFALHLRLEQNLYKRVRTILKKLLPFPKKWTRMKDVVFYKTPW